MEQTVQEQNVMIAAFEGRKFYGKHTIDKYGPGTSNAYPEMKYHESWDWLMPVGKKIFDFLRADWKKRPPHSATHGDMIEADIICAIREYNIKLAHEKIAEFIQWHNDYLAYTQPSPQNQEK